MRAPRAQSSSVSAQYKPKSTLVVSRAPGAAGEISRYRHSQPPLRRLTLERWAEIVREMDAQHLQVLVNLSGGTGARLADGLKLIAESPAPNRMVFFANLDFSDLEQPGYGARAPPASRPT